MQHHLDFWIPVAGLILFCAGLAFLIAGKLSPKKKDLDISAYKLAPIDMDAPLEGRLPFVGACQVCGLEHGSNAAWDGDKQACVDALLAIVPKRGEHGRFAKRA